MNPFELKALSRFSGFRDAFDFTSLAALTDFPTAEVDMENCVQTTQNDCCREIFFSNVFRETDIAWQERLA